MFYKSEFRVAKGKDEGTWRYAKMLWKIFTMRDEEEEKVEGRRDEKEKGGKMGYYTRVGSGKRQVQLFN